MTLGKIPNHLDPPPYDYWDSFAGGSMKLSDAGCPLPQGTKMTLGDIVYLKVAQEPCRGMITGIMQRIDGRTFYVTWEDASETGHYEMELSSTFVPEYAQE